MKIPILHIAADIAFGGGPHGYLFALRNAFEQSSCPLASEIIAERIGWPAVSYPPLRYMRRDLRGISERVTQKVGRVLLTPGARHTEVSLQIHYRMDVARQSRRNWARANAARLRQYQLVVSHCIFAADALVELDRNWCRDHLCLITHAPDFLVREIAGEIDEDCDNPAGAEHVIQRYTAWQEEIMNSMRAVIWPCQEAAESYCAESAAGLSFQNWEFAMTGVARLAAANKREELRTEWGVRPGQKAILFLGRPHPHKGFGVFAKMAALAKAQGRDDLVFLWGGQARRKPTTSALRHIGWVNDNGAALLAADLTVVPNLVTYMDIGVLQALSLGAPILLSARGGNKAVAAKVPGLPTFEPEANTATLRSIDQALDAFRTCGDLGAQMLRAWEDYFSPEIFVREHDNLVRRLLV